METSSKGSWKRRKSISPSQVNLFYYDREKYISKYIRNEEEAIDEKARLRMDIGSHFDHCIKKRLANYTTPRPIENGTARTIAEEYLGVYLERTEEHLARIKEIIACEEPLEFEWSGTNFYAIPDLIYRNGNVKILDWKVSQTQYGKNYKDSIYRMNASWSRQLTIYAWGVMTKFGISREEIELEIHAVHRGKLYLTRAALTDLAIDEEQVHLDIQCLLEWEREHGNYFIEQ